MTSIIKVDNIQDSTGNSAISIDSSGRVTTPARPSFRAIVTGNVESTGTIQYNVEDFDHGGNYDTSTYKFTAPVAGLYFFSAQAYSDGGVRCKLSIQKNGSDVASTQVNSGSNASNYEGLELATILDLDADDEISISSGSFNYHIAANASFFCGYLIG